MPREGRERDCRNTPRQQMKTQDTLVFFSVIQLSWVDFSGLNPVLTATSCLMPGSWRFLHLSFVLCYLAALVIYLLHFWFCIQTAHKSCKTGCCLFSPVQYLCIVQMDWNSWLVPKAHQTRGESRNKHYLEKSTWKRKKKKSFQRMFVQKTLGWRWTEESYITGFWYSPPSSLQHEVWFVYLTVTFCKHSLSASFRKCRGTVVLQVVILMLMCTKKRKSCLKSMECILW